MCSDGISEDIQKNKMLPFFEGYIKEYKSIEHKKRKYEINKMLRKWPVKGHSDDKTIVVLMKDFNE